LAFMSHYNYIAYLHRDYYIIPCPGTEHVEACIAVLD
jgi:hypothetical protein